MTKVKVVALSLLIILAPIAYLTILDRLLPHAGMKFYPGWEDDSFQENLWKLVYNRPIDANISNDNGVLKISASGQLSEDTIVAAQRWSGLDFDLTEFKYLKVSVMTSGIDVAARIVAWTDPDHGYVVVLKTYDDSAWHTEIVDLVYFLNIMGTSSSHLTMIELSMQQVYKGFNSTVCYRQLSFDSLEAA
jgi:hypothetical protein